MMINVIFDHIELTGRCLIDPPILHLPMLYHWVFLLAQLTS